MSRAALMCCTALALALSVGAAHAGPEIPWQFHGRWCSQEHKYGTDTLIFGRQGSVADCNMEISRNALVAGGGDAPDFVEVGEAGIAVGDAMRRERRVQLVG
jgi:hypothetical protein